MARAIIRNRVATARGSIVPKVNTSDRKHKQSFKRPPQPVAPSKNAIQKPRPANGKSKKS